MKSPISFPLSGGEINGQINPLAGGRCFKLKVAIRIGSLWRNENLAHVSIPQPNRLLIQLRVGVNYQWLSLIANKPYPQRLVRPDDSCFGMPRSRRFFA